MVTVKRKIAASYATAGKKAKHSDFVSYSVKEIDGEQYEYLEDDQYMVSSIDGAAFVEYDEVSSSYEPPKEVAKKAAESNKKTYARSSKTLEAKPAPVEKNSKVVKMTAAKIQQLKKEGKIVLKDGNLVMKS